MSHILETNDLSVLTVEEFFGSKIYSMNNFFKFPEKIVNVLDNTQPCAWKIQEQEYGYKNFNTIKYLDRRHFLDGPPIDLLYTIFSDILKEEPLSGLGNTKIHSNFFLMKDRDYNDYKNNYWCPHRDGGYNMIIYLNHYNGGGTNLYERIQYDHPETFKEHSDPWRHKSKYKVLKTLKAEFNKMYIFDGKKFLHGMAIEDDTFFKVERKNLVLFFKNENV
jgi:hypothetical protein